jgi:hypothetical protein
MSLLWMRNRPSWLGRIALCRRDLLSRGHTASGLLVLGAILLACGQAHAACPSFPPPVIKFVPLPSEMVRDISKTARELAPDSKAKPMPANYSRALSGAAAQSIALQKMPDGTVCAALQEVDFKLGFKRTLYVAQEFATDRCVADNVADFETPVVNSDDDALARFGAGLPEMFAADITAIGASAAATADEAKRPLMEKVSAVWKDRIFPAFSQAVGTAAAEVDMSRWRKASCAGATDRAFAAINTMPSDFSSGSWNALMQQAQQPSHGGMGNMTGSATAGMMGH